MNLLERIFSNLRWPDPESEDFVIESQDAVLKAVARQPGSAIKADEPYRADRPLRYRTVQRLLEFGDLAFQRADDAEGTTYIIVTAQGWNRITGDRHIKVDKP